MPREQPLRESLGSLNFGSQVAENERQQLAEYFVETIQWEEIASGTVDIVYGAKGTGKSAIYSLLCKKSPDFSLRGIAIVPAADAAGSKVFSELAQDTDPKSGEDDYLALWRLYVIVLLGRYFSSLSTVPAPAARVTEHLRREGLLDSRWSVASSFHAAWKYFHRLSRVKSVAPSMSIDPYSGNPASVSLKLEFDDATSSPRRRLPASALLSSIDDALTQLQTEAWVVFDRLDVAFEADPERERRALRALFRLYQELGDSRIKLKIFIRTDIWRRLTEGGFRQASHIVRVTTLRWDRMSLANLVARRFLRNEAIERAAHASRERILGDHPQQERLISDLLPERVDEESDVFGWILTRTADGSGSNAPREVIHLLLEALRRERTLLKLGVADADARVTRLFSAAALVDALREVSGARVERTLLAEYPELREWIEELEDGALLYSEAGLAALWQVEPTEARQRAARLVDVGFFGRRRSTGRRMYWIPYIYRPYLRLPFTKDQAWEFRRSNPSLF